MKPHLIQAIAELLFNVPCYADSENGITRIFIGTIPQQILRISENGEILEASKIEVVKPTSSVDDVMLNIPVRIAWSKPKGCLLPGGSCEMEDGHCSMCGVNTTPTPME